MTRFSRKALTVAIAAVAAFVASPALSGQNLWNKIKGAGKAKTEVAAKSDGETSGSKKKSGGKPVAEPVDINEMTLDENLRYPVVNRKQHEGVTKAMNVLAKDLAKRKLERVETMRDGEVIVATIHTDQLFAPNDTSLRGSASELLQPYRNLLKEGLYKLIVVAHTDNTGSETYTDWLSEARANAVYDCLSDGNNPDDLDLVSYALGATEPLKPNNSRANRAENRRVEIFIVPLQRLISTAATTSGGRVSKK